LRDHTVKKVSVKLSDRLDAKLTAAARRHKTTKSAVVRCALKAALRSVAKPKRGSALDLVRDLAGCVAGPTDLSTNKTYMKTYGR
jgi:hypothetical protein